MQKLDRYDGLSEGNLLPLSPVAFPPLLVMENAVIPNNARYHESVVT